MYTRRHTATRISKSKQAHRSDISLSDWNGYRYSDSDICERLMNIDTKQPGYQPVEFIDACNITPEEFLDRYASAQRPVVIRGALADWPAVSEGKWEFDALLKRFKHTLFKVGEDDNGRKLKVKMKTFMDYMSHQTDDSPLYLFESGMIGETSSLREDYWIPKYFPDDFLNLVGRENKPPHRWYVIYTLNPTILSQVLHRAEAFGHNCSS